MGEIIRFSPKYERERARLIRRPRAIYDSIFPPADPISGRQHNAPLGYTVSCAGTHSGDGTLLS
jgi:hypothetical protein